MDFGAVLFAFGLLMAGIWLIFDMSRDLRDEKRRTQEIEAALQHRPTAVRPPRRAMSVRAVVRLPAPSPQPIQSKDASRPVRETGATADLLQNLNAAFVRETFEKFIHK
jgi:hypothetical protein